jgi:hypothetical protein
MRKVVMKYLDNLIAWDTHLFLQIPSHFATVVRERYGVSPSEHIENTT